MTVTTYHQIEDFIKQAELKPRIFGQQCKRYEHDAGIILHLESSMKTAVFTLPRAAYAYSAPLGGINASWVPCELLNKAKKALYDVTRSDLIIMEHYANQRKVIPPEKRKLAQRFHQSTPIPLSTHQTTLMPDTLLCVVAGNSPVYVVIEPFGDAVSNKWTEIIFIPDKKPITETDFTAGRSPYVNIQETYGRTGKRRDVQPIQGRMGNNSRRGK